MIKKLKKFSDDIFENTALHFSQREIDVITCLVCGRTQRKSIGSILFISQTTVTTYIKSIMKKLSCHSTEGIVKKIETVFDVKKMRFYFDFLMIQHEIRQQKKDINFVVLLSDQKISEELKRLAKKTSFNMDIREEKNIKEGELWIINDQEKKCINLTLYTHYEFLLFDFIKNNPSSFLQNEKNEKEENDEHKNLKNKKMGLKNNISLIVIIVLTMGIFLKTDTFFKNDIIKCDVFFQDQKQCVERIWLVQSIRKKLNKPGINFLTLSGLSGIGKTTLAKMIAQKHQGTVWFFNAESIDSLKEGFKNLAENIFMNDAKKWNLIRSIEDEESRMRKVLYFIKKELIHHENWLFIFDNVENINEIKEYIPTDSKVWGNGNIIMTSKNAHLCIGEDIKIPPLSKEEAYELFCKEMGYPCNNNEQEEIYLFLKSIPPFPLDISLAGKYIKSTQISYSDYLQKINIMDIEKHQKDMIKSQIGYDKTRFEIIENAIARLLKNNKNYIYVFLLMSEMESIKISKKMLEYMFKKELSFGFILEIKKYFSCVDENKYETFFSIHRSIQHFISHYIHKNYERNQIQHFFNLIVEKIIQYEKDMTLSADYHELSVLITHIKKIMKNDYLSQEAKFKLEMVYCSCISRLHYPDHMMIFEKYSSKKHNPFHTLNVIDKARFWISLSEIMAWKGNYTDAKKLIEDGLNLFEKERYSGIEKTRAKIIYACIKRVLGDYQAAKIILDQIEKTEFKDNSVEKAYYLSQRAILNRDMGNYLKSFDYFKKSIQTIEKNKNLLDYHPVYGWIFSIYPALGYSQKMRKYINDNKKGYFSLGLSYAEIFIDCGEFDKAHLLIKKLKKSYEDNGYQKNYNYFTYLLPLLGKLYIHDEHYAKAEKILQNSLYLINKHYGDKHVKSAKVLCLLSKIDLINNKMKEAQAKLMSAYNILKDNHHADLYMVLEHLSDLYLCYHQQENDKKLRQQHYEQALFFLRSALDIAQIKLPNDSDHIFRIQKKLLKNFWKIPPFGRNLFKRIFFSNIWG
ncbi:MAG: hypothetical protein FADNKDHG_01201 [Holosporales bacterium]